MKTSDLFEEALKDNAVSRYGNFIDLCDLTQQEINLRANDLMHKTIAIYTEEVEPQDAIIAVLVTIKSKTPDWINLALQQLSNSLRDDMTLCNCTNAYNPETLMYEVFFTVNFD